MKKHTDTIRLTVPAAPAEDAPPAARADAAPDEFALFGIGAEDLDEIPPQIRARAVKFLSCFADGMRWRDCLAAAQAKPVHLWIARRKSKTYASAFDELRKAREWARVCAVEDAMLDAAVGDIPEDREMRPPDPRAAGLVLGAWDGKRYGRAAQGDAPQVVLNVQL